MMPAATPWPMTHQAKYVEREALRACVCVCVCYFNWLLTAGKLYPRPPKKQPYQLDIQIDWG